MSTPPDDDGIGIFSDGGGGAAARRSRSHWPRRILITFVILVVVILAAGAIYAASLNHSFNHNLKRANDLPPDQPTAPGESPRPQKSQNDNSLNFVLLGSDSRDPSNMQDNGRSDTLMIVHLASNRRSADIISFPRDMYVKIPGHGKNKINAAYSYGGPQLAVSTLEQLTDARMDHVAQVDFEGFINLTNTLGGVTIYNDHPFTDRGYTFPKGKITIQGQQALVFVRERHNLPNGDLDRAANQRKVVQAIIAKGMSGGTITNPLKFNSFVSGVAQNVTVDNSLTAGDVRNIALSLRMTPGNIKQIQAPITGFATVSGIGDVDVVDQAKMAELSKDLRSDDLAAYLKKYPG